MPALTTRPPGKRPSPPTIADLYFCIHAYQADCKACISSGDGWGRGVVESRKRNRYFGRMVLQSVFAYAGGGLSPAFCNYNEQAAAVRTPVRKKTEPPDTIRAAC